MSTTVELMISMLAFAFVSSITPGPNNMMLLSSGVNFGFRRTVPHMLGVSAGFFVMLLLIGAGLDSLFRRYPSSYTVMKVLGSLYLLYFAWRVANSGKPERAEVPTPGGGKALPISFLGACAFQWVNAKAWFMAITYFSNYIPRDSKPIFVIITCLLFAVVNLPCVGVWAYLGTKMERLLRTDSIRTKFNWAMALLLIATLIPVIKSI